MVRSVGASQQFRGILLQGRLQADDSTPVGSFTATDPNTRIGSCTPAEVRKLRTNNYQAS